jgi:uncharacterized repeat protein (TIGR01451 family)
MRCRSNRSMRHPWQLTTVVVLAVLAGRAGEANAVTGPVADLSLSVDAEPPAIVPGGIIDIQIYVANASPFDATNVVLRVPIPEHTTFVSWSIPVISSARATSVTPPPGGTGTVNACIESVPVPSRFNTVLFLLRVQVDPTEPQGETIAATVTIPAVRTDDGLWCPTTTYDPVLVNNTAVDTVTVSGPADIAVGASGSPDPVPAGTDLTYDLTITNAGPYDAQSAGFTDWYWGTLVSFTQESGPAFTLNRIDDQWKVTASTATLPAGTTAHFTLVVHIPESTSGSGTWENTIWGASATGDPDESNNRFTSETSLAAAP